MSDKNLKTIRFTIAPRWLLGLALIGSGAFLLLTGGFFVWQRLDARLAQQELERNVELTGAELGNEIRRIHNLLGSPQVLAQAMKAADGEEGALDALRESVQRELPNILVLKVLPAAQEAIETGVFPAPGFAVLEMTFIAEVNGVAPAQVHFAGTDRENLSFVQQIAGDQGTEGYLWLSMPTSVLTNHFRDYGIGGQYLALEQVPAPGANGAGFVLKSFGRTGGTQPQYGELIDGSLLRMAWASAAPPLSLAAPDLIITLAGGVLLLALGVLTLRKEEQARRAREAGQAAARQASEKAEREQVLRPQGAALPVAEEETPPLPEAQPAAAAPPRKRFGSPVGVPVTDEPETAPSALDDAGYSMHPGIFRAYDIRGVYGRTLDAAVAEAIGRAIGSTVLDGGGQQVVVARDGRLSGPAILNAVTEGLLASGCDVLDIGAAPTPVLYFAVHELGAGSGVMVTGSHNPPEYNGFKIVVDGQTLAGDEIQALRSRIENGDLRRGQGRLMDHKVLDLYAQRIGTDIQLERPLKVVVDCGNGIAGVIAPKILQAIGAEVTPLYADVDGAFPNHHPDPSEPANLMDLKLCVRNFNADLGLAFDGDGDRLGVVTPDGEIIWPDRLLMLFAADVLGRNPKATIIYDVKCSRRLAEVIRQAGGRPVMWRTGHSLIKRKMAEEGAPLAGEMSGHFFFKERWYGFDDAIYAACRLLEILALDRRPPAEVLKALPAGVATPEIKVSMKEGRAAQFVEEFASRARFEGAQVHTIDGLRADFPDGFGLLRASNTTPVLVLRFEADDDTALHRIQRLFREQILEINPYLDLPF